MVCVAYVVSVVLCMYRVVWCCVWGVLCVVHMVCCVLCTCLVVWCIWCAVCCVCEVRISACYMSPCYPDPHFVFLSVLIFLMFSSYFFLLVSFFPSFLPSSICPSVCLTIRLSLSLYAYSSMPLPTIPCNTSIDLSAADLDNHPCTYLSACCVPGRSCPSSGVGR
jgi:hypothetical protein